ncbi:3-hydroxyisobutyrate dehydrogenase, mitochondrial [Manis javanica]|nr:3-hydroxyisobutyrate dehydrogenase, mitochondrial [Manis javanica]
MGAPMAGHLLTAGHQLFVNTLGKIPAQIAESSATQCTTARGVAERADIIFLMLPDTPDVEKVLFGGDGVAAGLKGSSGKVVVDMSSISPVATKDFARRIEAIGAQYLDAPVSGGEVGAKNATLSIMVGGPGTCSRARAAVRAHGQEHHPGGRQWRRPDRQGGQPDHRGP